MSDTQTLYLRPPVWALLLAVLVGGSFYVYGKSMESVDRTPAQISVTGEAKISAKPDIAEISFGVQTGRQRTADIAMQNLSQTMQKVFDALKAAGIPEGDINTEQLAMNPSYDYTTAGQQLRGYEASQSLRVKVRDMAKTTAVLGAATGAGANQVGGIQFIIDDPEKVRAQVRAEAIQEAQEKAQVLAQQLGMKLGKIRGFSEGGGGMPPVYMMRAEAMGSADSPQAAPPLPAGDQELSVQVTVNYELY